MKIEISNQQKRYRWSTTALRKYARWIMEQVQKRDPNTLWGGLSLVITDHAGISKIHADFFGDVRTTDVISFAYPPGPPEYTSATGEVIVNIDQVIERGPRHNGLAQEWALYIAHGCHHLTGADDQTPRDRARMRRVERRWIKQAAEAGLLDALTPLPRRERS